MNNCSEKRVHVYVQPTMVDQAFYGSIEPEHFSLRNFGVLVMKYAGLRHATKCIMVISVI